MTRCHWAKQLAGIHGIVDIKQLFSNAKGCYILFKCDIELNISIIIILDHVIHQPKTSLLYGLEYLYLKK